MKIKVTDKGIAWNDEAVKWTQKSFPHAVENYVDLSTITMRTGYS